MAAIVNLEDLPQLVMEKITSFLNHKQLLTLEQVSMKLKSAVDAHFSITDHLIIGLLPDVDVELTYDEATAKARKCLDGLLKMITRCGFNLRTIQITIIYQCPDVYYIYGCYNKYIEHFLASAEMSNNCPNVENIIASSNVELLDSHAHHDVFRQKQMLVNNCEAEIYANNIKLSTGGLCKLRSILFDQKRVGLRRRFKRFINLFSNIVQMALCGDDDEGIFIEFLPQLIENGLKYLYVHQTVKLRIAKMYCNIGKNLRTLNIAQDVFNDDDLAGLNKLQLTKNVELRIKTGSVDYIAQFNENVCNSIVCCKAPEKLTDYSPMTKLKMLQEFEVVNYEQLKVLAEGAFPQLRYIKDINHMFAGTNCDPCDLQRFLPQLLINNGNHLAYIESDVICGRAMDVVWKALKHCKAAKVILFEYIVVNSPLIVTADDIRGICDLPNLQLFVFAISKEGDTTGPLRKLMETTVAEYKGLQIQYKLYDYYFEQITLSRIHF